MEVNSVKNFFFQCAAEYAQDMFSGCVFTSICHSVHRRVYTPPRHPRADTPLGRHPSGQTPSIGRQPSRQKPLWADTPRQTPPYPFGQTPPGQTPQRRPVQWMVRILLECILVFWDSSIRSGNSCPKLHEKNGPEGCVPHAPVEGKHVNCQSQKWERG